MGAAKGVCGSSPGTCTTGGSSPVLNRGAVTTWACGQIGGPSVECSQSNACDSAPATPACCGPNPSHPSCNPMGNTRWEVSWNGIDIGMGPSSGSESICDSDLPGQLGVQLVLPGVYKLQNGASYQPRNGQSNMMSGELVIMGPGAPCTP